MGRALLVVLSSLALAAPAKDRPYIEYKNEIYLGELFELRLNEVLPPDAAQYVDRFRECGHWGGEEAHDADRAKQIASGIERSCDGLTERKRALDDRYPSGTKEYALVASIIKEIEAGKDMPSFVFSDPEKKSAVLDRYYEAHAQSVIRQVARQVPEHEAAVAAVRQARRENKPLDAALQKARMTQFMLGVQQRYWDDVMNNVERLHPKTRDQIKAVGPALKRALATAADL